MNRAVAEEFEIFLGREINPGDWLWCRCCRRCYKAAEFRKSMDGNQIYLLCHYRDCQGDLPIDSRLWSRLIADNSGLPKNPQRGKVYDLSIEFRPKVVNVEPNPGT